jgi:hypothetical protein
VDARPTVPSCEIELAFADGAYLFRLPLAQISELQNKCGCGLGALFARVMKGRYRFGDEIVCNPLEADYHVLDLVETIRLGLIGGGRGDVNGQAVKVDPISARGLVDNYVLNRPLSESWATAAMVLGACIEGYVAPMKGGDPPKKARPAKTKVGSTTPAP